MIPSRTLCQLSLVGFAVLSAVRDLWAKDLFSQVRVDPVFLTWFGSVFTWIVFLAVAVLKSSFPEENRFTIAPYWKPIVLLNVGTLIAFTTSFLAISYLNAYVNAVIDYGATPVIMSAVAVAVRGEQIRWRGLVGIILSLGGIGILSVALIPLEHHVLVRPSFLGMGLAATSCLALSLTQVWNKELVEVGFRREKVLILRFPLLIIVLGVWALFRTHPSEFDIRIIASLSAWSAMGLAIPLFLIVFAFERLNVKDLSAAFFLIPVFTFIGSVLLGHMRMDSWLILYALGGALTMLGVYIAEKEAKGDGKVSV